MRGIVPDAPSRRTRCARAQGGPTGVPGQRAARGAALQDRVCAQATPDTVHHAARRRQGGGKAVGPVASQALLPCLAAALSFRVYALALAAAHVQR